MDMKLLEEGKPEIRTGDLTLEAYASIASRQRRRETFFRTAAIHFLCAVISAVACCYASVRNYGNGGGLPDIALFADPGTARIMLVRFFILSCIPAACFASAFTAVCRAVCAACSALCGGFCGAVMFRTVYALDNVSAASGAIMPLLFASVAVYLTASTAIFSAACVSFRACGRRYGVTAEDRDCLFGYLMSAASLLLVLCSLTLLVPDLMTFFSR